MKYIVFLLFFFIACNDKPINLPFKANSFYSDTVFYINLQKHSGSYRFFVVNIKNNKILTKGLCCNGKTDNQNNIIFSNKISSNCSSKGAYKIGNSYIGKFGKAYKLHGLEKSNNNAFKRNIVLHSYKYIPQHQIPFYLFKSQGCPTVNPEYLKELSTFIDRSKKPILLYIN